MFSYFDISMNNTNFPFSILLPETYNRFTLYCVATKFSIDVGRQIFMRPRLLIHPSCSAFLHQRNQSTFDSTSHIQHLYRNIHLRRNRNVCYWCVSAMALCCDHNISLAYIILHLHHLFLSRVSGVVIEQRERMNSLKNL